MFSIEALRFFLNVVFIPSLSKAFNLIGQH